MTTDMHNGNPHYQHSIAIVLLKTMGVPARVDLHQNSYINSRKDPPCAHSTCTEEEHKICEKWPGPHQ